MIRFTFTVFLLAALMSGCHIIGDRSTKNRSESQGKTSEEGEGVPGYLTKAEAMLCSIEKVLDDYRNEIEYFSFIIARTDVRAINDQEISEAQFQTIVPTSSIVLKNGQHYLPAKYVAKIGTISRNGNGEPTPEVTFSLRTTEELKNSIIIVHMFPAEGYFDEDHVRIQEDEERVRTLYKLPGDLTMRPFKRGQLKQDFPDTFKDL